MSDAEFRMFAELLRRHCGLHFGPDSRFLLERRARAALRELAIRSFSRLSLPAAQRRAPATASSPSLIDELTTNETYFFRERSQLRALIERDPARAAASQRRARGARPDQHLVGGLLERRGALQRS